MRISDVHRFFKELDRRLPGRAAVIITGGAAAIIYGVKRATQDIDFEVALGRSGRSEMIQTAIEDAGRATGITPQYAEDIDRWSSIALPNKASRSFLKLKNVHVRVLDPEPWSIGKLTRYLDSDISDLRTVLSRAETDPAKTVRYWGRALGQSPASSAQTTFRRQVESFIDNHARAIWGQKADARLLKIHFSTAANSAKKRAGRGRKSGPAF